VDVGELITRETFKKKNSGKGRREFEGDGRKGALNEVIQESWGELGQGRV